MTLPILLSIYCVLILLASLAGGMLPMVVKLTHRRMEIALSFVSGVMLGIAVLHLLPHAWMEYVAATGEASIAAVESVAMWMLAGFVVMFLVERFFCFHHHDAPKVGEAGAAGDEHSHHHGHDHSHGHHHHHHHGHDRNAKSRHRLSWSGAAIGLTLHTLINGVALGASTSAEWGHGHESTGLWFAGLGTFLVIFLHKPFDALTISTLLATGGHGLRLRHLVNALFALVIPLGVVLFFLGVDMQSGNAALFASHALAFSAGAFLCIALSDLLPELQFHQHDRLQLTLALLVGLGLAWGISQLEHATHAHEHDDASVLPVIDAHDHEH